jgi:ankyrin repeat protein
MSRDTGEVIDFEPWLSEIRSNPRNWILTIIRSGQAELAMGLIQNDPGLLDIRLSGNETPLLAAASFGRHELAEALLQMGAKLDFISAVSLGRMETVRVMLEQSPHLAISHSPDRWGAIHIASRDSDTRMIELLLSFGATVDDTSNSNKLTPLYFARNENAELLLAKGADINAPSKNGFTILHYAAQRGEVPFVQFLLDHGARPDVQTDGRQTPWALAVRRGHRSVAALL